MRSTGATRCNYSAMILTDVVSRFLEDDLWSACPNWEDSSLFKIITTRHNRGTSFAAARPNIQPPAAERAEEEEKCRGKIETIRRNECWKHHFSLRGRRSAAPANLLFHSLQTITGDYFSTLHMQLLFSPARNPKKITELWHSFQKNFQRFQFCFWRYRY